MWRTVVYRMLFATVFMQALMTISQSTGLIQSTQLIISAIGLKTKGSFAKTTVSLFAFIPVYICKHWVVDDTRLVANDLDAEEDNDEDISRRPEQHRYDLPMQHFSKSCPDIILARDVHGNPRTIDDIFSDHGQGRVLKKLLHELLLLKEPEDEDVAPPPYEARDRRRERRRGRSRPRRKRSKRKRRRSD